MVNVKRPRPKGEIADFIHVDGDSLAVTLIHVKGAESTSINREISAKAYEVVTSQAVKNAIFLDDDLLVERLKSPPTLSPATWTDGSRENDRTYMIEAIGARDARCSSKQLSYSRTSTKSLTVDVTIRLRTAPRHQPTSFDCSD